MPEQNEAIALARFLHQVLSDIHEDLDPRSKVPLQDSTTARERAKRALDVAKKSGVLS